MAKINQEEYEVLKDLKGFGYLYITRDTRNNIYLFEEIPVKHQNKFWLSAQFVDTGVFKPSYEDMFHFIQWEDEEPYNVQELIEKYERYEIENIHVERKHPMFNCNRFNGFYNANIAIWDRLDESEEE